MVAPRQWIELKIPICPEIEEGLTNYLFETGISGCYQQDDVVIAYYNRNEWNKKKYDELINYLSALKELDFPISDQSIQQNVIEDKDWNALWKQSLQPIYILPDVLIKPTWVDITTPPNTIIIEIDPQMAFGSGYHATTQLLIKLMRPIVRSQHIVLDVGTGSGILAIAAVKMAARDVSAFDIDPIAVTTAQENSRINKTDGYIRLFAGTIDSVKKISFDVILANINSKEIIRLIPLMKHRLAVNGTILLSGILIEEKEILTQALAQNALQVDSQTQQDEWLGLLVSHKT